MYGPVHTSLLDRMASLPRSPVDGRHLDSRTIAAAPAFDLSHDRCAAGLTMFRAPDTRVLQVASELWPCGVIALPRDKSRQYRKKSSTKSRPVPTHPAPKTHLALASCDVPPRVIAPDAARSLQVGRATCHRGNPGPGSRGHRRRLHDRGDANAGEQRAEAIAGEPGHDRLELRTGHRPHRVRHHRHAVQEQRQPAGQAEQSIAKSYR